MATQQIKLYNPSKPQLWATDVVHRIMPFITLLKYGRQTGKSYWAIMDMLVRGMNNKNQKIRFVVPAYSLAVKHMQTIDQIFADHEDIKWKIFKKIKYKEQEYHFHNGTICSFLSAEAEDNLRGDTCHFMYIDEAAFMKESTYTEILLPMLTRTKGRIAMFSTPNGKNWFYDLYNKGKKKENQHLVYSIDATYLDLSDQEDYPDILRVIEALKSSMTTASFNREVMGEFVSDQSLFSGLKQAVKSDKWFEKYYEALGEIVNGMFVKATKKYIGIDIGVIHDYTVLTCLDSNNVVVDIDRFNMTDEGYTHKQFKQRIFNFIQKNRKNLVAAYMEINNKELLFEELEIEYELNELMPIRTTPTNKPEMVEVLVKLFDTNNIRLPQNEQLEKELYAFTSVQNKITGKWQYKGTDNIHDDMVMSLILAAYCKHEESGSGFTEVY